MPKQIFIVLFIFYLFANLFNLGKLNFNYKEAKQAIISLQLNKSSNLRWQTILGKPYFKKPPLVAYYTSILFKMFGDNEAVARFGQLIFIVLIAFLPFIFKDDFKDIDAFFFAFVFLSSAIVLESINFYSIYPMGVFFLFLAIRNVYFKQKYFAMWLIMSFLALGLSAIFLFYAIVLGFSVCEKNTRYMTCQEHLISIVSIIFLSLIGIALYSLNIKSLHYLIGSLFLGFLESFDFRNYVFHIVLFPFVIFLLFLPWSMFAKQLLKKEDSILYRFAFCATITTLSLFLFLPFENYLIIAPFFAIVMSYKTKINSMSLKITLLIGALLILGAFVFGYLFVKGSNYVLLCAFVFSITFIMYVLSKRYKPKPYIWIIVLIICLKAAYSMILIPYMFSYKPNMALYGKNIANIVLKNKAKYVMSNNVHLDLLYYVEKESNLPIYIPQHSKGILITQDKDALKKVYGSEFTCYGVFYVGEY